MTEAEREKFITLIERLSDEDRQEFIRLWDNEDHYGLRELLKVYGVTYIVDVKEHIPDGEVSAFFDDDGGLFASSVKAEFNEVISEMIDSGVYRVNTPLEINSLDELKAVDKKLYLDVSSNKLTSAKYGDEANILLKAEAMLRGVGCEHIASEVLKLAVSSVLDGFFYKIDKELKRREVISEDRRKAGRGNQSKYKTAAIEIAKNTWGVYPHASLNGVAEKIFAHLESKWNDNPTAGAIKSWLSESGMNPDVKPKNRKFKLIISE